MLSNKTFKSNKIQLPNFIAIPTTSGTGSEINSWGTVWQNYKKLSVSGNILRPNYAILDANLCKTMPMELTISSALDAFSHALESIWNKNHTLISDEVSIVAIKKILYFLPLVILKKNNFKYRSEIQLASLLAGISMSQTKTALCHSISYPLTSIYGIPHGIACSLTLSEVAHLNTIENKERMKLIGIAFSCNNKDIKNKMKDFLISVRFKEIFKPYSNIKIDKNINFINKTRTRNSLIQVTNKIDIKQPKLNNKFINRS